MRGLRECGLGDSSATSCVCASSGASVVGAVGEMSAGVGKSTLPVVASVPLSDETSVALSGVDCLSCLTGVRAKPRDPGLPGGGDGRRVGVVPAMSPVAGSGLLCASWSCVSSSLLPVLTSTYVEQKASTLPLITDLTFTEMMLRRFRNRGSII